MTPDSVFQKFGRPPDVWAVVGLDEDDKTALFQPFYEYANAKKARDGAETNHPDLRIGPQCTWNEPLEVS